MTDSELLALIGELYSLSKANADFLQARFFRNPETLEKYKAHIKRHLAPNMEGRGGPGNISIREAKKAVSEYRKATHDPFGLAELMVYYVECGTDFSVRYGDMESKYYDSLGSVFESALQLMKPFPETIREDLLARLEKVIKKAGHMGYGYEDFLTEALEDHFPERPMERKI